jgi:hypothetical protein
MADIVGAEDPMNDVEVAQDAPHSEALMNKIAANINFLLGKKFRCRTVIATETIAIPAGAEIMGALGMGGGGAGGQGGQGTDGGDDGGGGGGGGGAAILTGPYFIPCTELDSITVTIGAGGVSNGADGGASTITGIAGSIPSIYFPGAEGGDTGSVAAADGGAGGNLLIWDSQIDTFLTSCGVGGAGAKQAGGLMGAASQAPSYKLVLGGTVAAGGAAGLHGNNAPGTDDDHGGGGGGGASSLFGTGGAGGNGQNNSGAGQTAGAAATGYGAGGGGGGGGREAGSAAGAAGGAGTHGIVFLFFFGEIIP